MIKEHGNVSLSWKPKTFPGTLISEVFGQVERVGWREDKGVDTEEEVTAKVKVKVEGLTVEGRRAPAAQ